MKKVIVISFLIFFTSLTQVYAQKKPITFKKEYSWNNKSHTKKLPPVEKADKIHSLSFGGLSDTIFPNEYFAQFHSVKHLAIGGTFTNNIKFDTSHHQFFENLETITLAYCHLDNFPIELAIAKNLKKIEIFTTNLDSIPSEIQYFKNLEEVSIHISSVSFVAPELWDLEKLKIVNLSNNKLTHLPYIPLETSKIEQLFFDINECGRLPIYGEINKNNIEYLTEIEMLNSYFHIKSLNLLSFNMRNEMEKNQILNQLKYDKKKTKVLIYTPW